MGKFARFSVFARGRIVGKAEEGASQKKIRRTVLKKDGRRGSLRAIQGIIEQNCWESRGRCISYENKTDCSEKGWSAWLSVIFDTRF